MKSRPLVWIGMFVGSTIGGYIPSLWGAGLFSISAIILSGIGALLGIWLGFTYSDF
jgi:hypothetical protein